MNNVRAKGAFFTPSPLCSFINFTDPISQTPPPGANVIYEWPLCKKTIDLPGEGKSLQERMLLSYFPSSNTLVWVSDPCTKYHAHLTPITVDVEMKYAFTSKVIQSPQSEVSEGVSTLRPK